MIKYSIPFLLGATVIFLGLNLPFQPFSGPRRDPVPESQKVAHSINCAGCHGTDATGLSQVDKQGNDVSIFNDWQFSMMGLSAYDPFWRATLAHEVNQYPTQQDAIETTCLKCHAPLGSVQAHLDGLPYSYAAMLQDTLGLDGVSCSSCHQQPAKNLGKRHSGNFLIDTNRIMFGPYPNPFIGPMELYVGFEPEFAEHIFSSGICAGCHTLITEALEDDGTPSGQFFIEQATYHEWLNSVYPLQGKECQSCHVPYIQDSVVIATDLLALEKRYPYGLHQFFGANTAMLSLMKENRKELNIAPNSPDTVWNESITNNRISLRKAGVIEINSIEIQNDTLILDLTVINKAGHKLPSGYPSRVAWIQIELSENTGGEVIYKNGFLDDQGHLTGRDFPFEPHHEISSSENDVQIYEMVMEDLQGNLTTRLNAAAKPSKDNRLLPLGFRMNHSVYDTVAIWGDALIDNQYGSESHLGKDNIEYRIVLNGQKGLAKLDISLRYHTFPARWMNDLFEHDSIEQIAQFKSHYQGYELFNEIIDSVVINELDLSTTSVSSPQIKTQIELFPNPGNGTGINVINNHPQSVDLRFNVIDVSGTTLHSGKMDEKISLPKNAKPGVYYFLFYNKSGLIGIKPYILL